MHLRPYRFRLKTASETFQQQQHTVSDSNKFSLYFKGEQGLTQTIVVPLNKLNEDVYERTMELLDVGNLSLVHVKLDAKNVRWKLTSIELEQDDGIGQKTILNFPISRWLDSNQKLDVLLNEGPVQLASTYTIIVRTGTINSCSQANVQLALIGDGASTLPFNLNSNSTLIQCTPRNLFQAGAKDVFHISPFESSDIGQLFHVQIWCDCVDQLPYYCESIEIINNITDEKYFFLVNHWFGPNLEQQMSISVTNRSKESNIYTISIKTIDVSDSNGENVVFIHMKFSNGKSYEDELSSSETHKIPFRKENIDFFLVTVDDIGNDEIVSVKVSFLNKSVETTATQVQWNCAWIEIRDIFYQRNYCYHVPKTLVSNTNNQSYDYVSLERITDLPCSKNCNN